MSSRAYNIRPLGSYPVQSGNTVRSLSFSPDGRLLASGGDDGTVQIWQVATSTPVANWTPQESIGQQEMYVDWSPDSTRLAVSTWKTVFVVDVATKRQLTRYDKHREAITGVCWSPDSTCIASWGNDPVVHLWDARTGRFQMALGGHYPTHVDACSWSPDGARLALARPGERIEVSDVHRGVLLFTCQMSFPSKVSGSHRTCVAWSPDGTHLATAGGRGEVYLWDAATGGLVSMWEAHPFQSAIYALALCPAGRYLATASVDRTVRVWDTEGDRQRALALYDYEQDDGYVHVAEGLAWSPDRATIATSSRTIDVWQCEPLCAGQWRYKTR